MALTPETFASLLAALGPDAGDRYEALRRRLLIFFAVRRCPAAEEAADATLDRAARRLAEGVAVEPSIEAYVLGIARNVAREVWKKPQAVEVEWRTLAAREEAGPDTTADCLDECLAGMTPLTRGWVERFYSDQGAAKIRARQALAAELGIDLNALRVRLHRIRAKLEACVRTCLRGNETGPGAIH